MVLVAWKLPAFTSDEWQAASAMINTLGRQLGQFNSDWDFATSVNVFSFGGLLAPVAVAALELYDASDVDEALGWVWKATSGLHRDFDEGVFDKRIKNMIKADVITQVESIDARATVLADLVQFRKSFDFRGNGEFLIEELKKIDELDGGDFRDFMKGTLAQDNSVVLVVKSSKKGRKGDKRAPLKYSGRTHEADKTALVNPEEAQRPLPIPGEKTLLSGAEKYALPNGMTVMLLPYRSMPVVTSLLMFDAGSAHEDRERAGLADVTASFLEPPRDSDFWTVGVTFGGWSDPDRTWFIARGVEIYLDVALKGMERIVKVGQHDQDTIEKWQRLMKNLLATDRQKRDWVYRRELDGALFGPQHPYTVTGSPTPETVRRINRDAAMAFKRRHYTARNATLIVAGSFEPAAARKLIAENYGDWPGGHQDAPVARDLPPRAGPIYFGVIEPDSPQMAVTVAYPTVGWIDDNTAARMVLAEMLNLRMAKIRTQLGSTYGTYAQLAQRVGPSAYRMGGNIDAERAGESLKAMRDEIERLRKGDGFDVDFATARRIVVRQLLDEATDSMSLATRLAELARHHIPPAMHNQLLAGIARLTPAQVKALVERELAPDREVVACKGDRAVLSRAFQAAEIGPARLIDPTAPQQPGGR
jgi:zinc protease